MCGIAGLIGRPDEGYSVARRLVAALRHRGPDDEGFDRPLSTVTLVHTRLAVLDLSSAGHQPMRDHPSDGRMSNCVVFNGEIFDYPDLARELAREGWLCRTRCDTEVILHAFRAWGPDCVDHLRGMFAFCLVDTQRGVAHLYRDRLGIKPMYLYRPHGGGLVFSSELRAILGLGAEIAPRSINARALESYFAQGAVQGYESLVEGVSMLRPSEHLALDVGNGKELVRRVYWDFNPPSDDEFDREDEVEKLRTLARQTVKLHLLSDAALGVFLSSGVDSTALLTMLREVFSGTLRTLTVGFDQKEYDEAGGAALVAKSLETDHTTLLLTGDAATTMLDESLSAMDQPTVDGFNTYFISRSARQLGLTVAVSGLGGDELFGGYASFTDVPKALSLRKYPIAKWPIDIATLSLVGFPACRRHETSGFAPAPDGSTA